ncbi:response regulator [Paenibacillus thalictri]|nr:response regulator [Paenibacillus thalictri]
MFNLLIVDDEKHLVDSMADTISWGKYGIQEVFKAYSAVEALETIKIWPVHIVVTDIRMPGMNGMELIGKLAEQWSHIQIIILSGHADFQYARTAMKHKIAEYLLKPVNDEDITEAVSKVSARLTAELDSYRLRLKQQQLMNQNLPLMRANLLSDLLHGKRMHPSLIDDLRDTYGIPFAREDAVSIVLIRMEGKLAQFDYSDRQLMEFSVINMMQEVFADDFYIWHSKEVHDYLVILIKSKQDALVAGHSGEKERWLHRVISERAEQLQRAVQFYLQGSISILISRPFEFPRSLLEAYRRCVTRFRNQVGTVQGIFLNVDEMETKRAEAQSLVVLYEPLTMSQMMDLGKWVDAKAKLADIVEELQSKWPASHEHLLEVYYSLAHAFLHFMHSNGLQLAQVHEHVAGQINEYSPILSVSQLQGWAERLLTKLEVMTDTISRDGRSQIVKLVNQYIETHLGIDISLQTIADHVRFNAAYLSKIYKLETGEGISEYALRLRMDKAMYLLKQPHYKIYEISELLGYQNPQYFSKLFKREYGCTPQEFRDKLQ